MRILSIIGGAALVLGLSATAQAKDMDGKWGFGGSAQMPRAPNTSNNAPAMTIDGIYWLGDIGLEGRFGLGINAPDGEDSSTAVGFTGGVGFIYNFAKFDTVNIGTGLRVDGRLFASGAENSDAEVTVGFGIPLRGEYFFSENFAVNASVGLGLDFANEANDTPSVIDFGTASGGAFGSFGFTFYMN